MTKRRRDENATENPREYYKWTDQTDSVLVECMQEMAKQQQVENGQFKAGAFKEMEKMMEVLLDDHFEGINIDNVIPIVDEETNAGFEHQTDSGVDVTADNEKDKGTSACPTSRPKLVPKRRVIDRRGTVESVIADISCDLSEMKPILEKTLETITRIGTGPGESEDVSNKRKALLSEISSIEGLTRAQVFDATMTLCGDEHKTQIFFQLDNNEDRHLFILRLLR
ncbi:hypothetical protein LINPERPRIM_LOCUS33314 [Linum perenne]